MEPTKEMIDALQSDLQERVPDWLGDNTQVFVRYAPLKNAVEITTYFNFQGSRWVKINGSDTNDGPIDVTCGMRSDWEFSPKLMEEDVSEHIAKLLFAQIYADIADLILSPSYGDSNDPLLHYGDRARFFPRDETRRMILTGLDYFAPRIAEHSPFREEDWYKEWESKKTTKSSS